MNIANLKIPIRIWLKYPLSLCQLIRYCVYKTVGTSEIYIPISLPFLNVSEVIGIMNKVLSLQLLLTWGHIQKNLINIPPGSRQAKFSASC